MTIKMKKRCKWICDNGHRCKHEATINGYCITHYWKDKKMEKQKRDKKPELIIKELELYK